MIINKKTIVFFIFFLLSIIIIGVFYIRIYNQNLFSGFSKEKVNLDLNLFYYDTKDSSILYTKIHQKSNDGYRILNVIDGNCSICILKLQLWKEFMDRLDNNSIITTYFILNIRDSIMFEYNLKPLIDFNHPLFFDYSGEFFKTNAALTKNITNTYILDENGFIIFKSKSIDDESIINEFNSFFKNEENY
ncbi:MAG: hypothetical protein AB7S50_06170 [Bacteroidales bacterium]